ncbi:MAG: hypothetical protein ACC652_12715 [Acidimicrobiales bacterium]
MASRELRLVGNGLRKRCPVCGQGHLFRRWSTIIESCPRCHLRFNRIDGHSLGALGLNTVVTVTALFGVVAVSVILTVPDIPVAPLVVLSLAVALVLPVLFAPFSWTLWTAFDLIMRPPAADEIASKYYEPWQSHQTTSKQ